jgi:hypothetical protein
VREHSTLNPETQNGHLFPDELDALADRLEDARAESGVAAGMTQLPWRSPELTWTVQR